MFLELIATFAAGLGAAGVVLLLSKLSRGRLPRWAMPVAAGVAMIATTISSEYAWGGRAKALLPEGVVVVETITESNFYRPWSYLFPVTTRFAALDIETMQTNAAAPDVRLAEVYLFARWRASAKVPQLIDCAQGARANVTDAALADPATAGWSAADPEMIAVACKGETTNG